MATTESARRLERGAPTQVPRNCIILGAGRSGTSLLGGMLSEAGYYMGDKLLPKNDSNPKGHFEDRKINYINEELLAALEPPSLRKMTSRLHRWRFHWGDRWLANIPLGTEIPPSPRLERLMARETSRAPFCFKDPRFAYTVPVWRPFVGDAIFLCVFREPARTATSLIREVGTAPYTRHSSMTFGDAVELWTTMYMHVLENHQWSGRWLFFHYDQLISGLAVPLLEDAINAKVKQDFADAALARSSGDGDIGARAKGVYGELCRLASFHGQDRP